MFEEFKRKLKSALSCDLPGKDAHLMMMPTARDEKLKIPEFIIPPVKSAVLVLLYQDENERLKFPLIQRPEYNGAHSGQIALPGGKAEETDSDLIHTALREAEEEIGINPLTVDVLGCLSDLHISVSNFVVTPVIGFTQEKPNFRLDKNEVVAVIESELQDIINPVKRKEGTITIRNKYQIQTPYFDIGNKIVWGATAMMLSELSILIRKTGMI